MLHQLIKYSTEEELIAQCLVNNYRAQEELYRLYSRKMFGLCLRFAKNRADAADILQESFIKVFRNLGQFRGEGSFEGWIRRTVTTTAISHYKKFLFEARQLDIADFEETEILDETINDEISANEMILLLQQLPDQYRLVFNLYVVEGYTHEEIAEMLEMRTGTSKSQLSRAKNILREKITALTNYQPYTDGNKNKIVRSF
jgi:RNA polymerase sigma factor (sigma-70 family)